MPRIPLDDKLREQILAEAKSRIPLSPGEGEITANGLAAELNCTAKQARSILADMVEDGIVTVRTNGVENGKSCKVYKYLKQH